MADTMGILGSSPLTGHLLAPTNLTRPPTLTHEDDQFNFIDLACVCINLHGFISCPGVRRGQVGLLLLLLDLIFASSSEGLAVWFDPLLLSDYANWFISLY